MTVFYVSLFLASLVVAALVVWFYRVVVQASRETYKSFLPSSNEEVSMASMARVTASRRASRGRGTPWGWKNTNKTKGRVSVGVPVHARTSSESVGWPYRQEPFSFDTAGQSGAANPLPNKPRRIVKGAVNKPWGW